VALASGWLAPRATPLNGRAPTMPVPQLDLTDLLLLVGVKEAQLVVLQRQLADLQAQTQARTNEIAS
jgi:hypothetical protein